MRDKILIVDDEPDILSMLKDYFEYNGYIMGIKIFQMLFGLSSQVILSKMERRDSGTGEAIFRYGEKRW